MALLLWLEVVYWFESIWAKALTPEGMCFVEYFNSLKSIFVLIFIPQIWKQLRRMRRSYKQSYNLDLFLSSQGIISIIRHRLIQRQ